MQPHGVVVEEVEEDGVEKRPNHLRRRWIGIDLGALLLVGAAGVTRRDGQDLFGPEVHRGRQRRGHADAAVAEPAAVDAYRREQQRQSGRSQDMVDAQLATHELALAVRRGGRVALYPGDGLAGRIAGGRDRNGLRPC